jgi:hypothetical protein
MVSKLDQCHTTHTYRKIEKERQLADRQEGENGVVEEPNISRRGLL